MKLQRYQLEVLDLLVDHEKAMRTLYEEYAKRFPEHKHFWTDLADEEKEHADSLIALASKIRSGLVLFKEGRFEPEKLQASLQFVKSQIERAQKGKMTLVNAVSRALAIENAMIESKFYDVFEDDTEELKSTLLTLAEGFRKHIEKINKQWADRIKETL